MSYTYGMFCSSNRYCCAAAVVVWSAVFSPAARAFAPTERSLELYRGKFAASQEAFREQLEKYAAELEQAQQPEGVKAVRELLAVETDADPLSLQPLPRKVRPVIAPGLPEAERTWRLKFRYLREQQAQALYDLSRQVMQADLASLSYEIVREAARLNSDHIAARRLLGFVRDGDEWLTPFEHLKRQHHEIWDDRFGWIPKADLAKYEKGERLYKRRWITAAQDRELHRNFKNAWEIRTEHFLVKTNYSLEGGVEIARKLEDYYHFFIQAFPGLFNSRAQMKKLFSSGSSAVPPRPNRDPFVVYYFATKEEYVTRLKPRIPLIAITNGLYHNGDRVSYFFHRDVGDLDPTLYHEATHQILFESRNSRREIAKARDFWAVEGFACYMESYRVADGKVSLGDPWFIRFDNARARLIADRYYRRLEQFVSWGQDEYQRQPQEELPQNYSQGAGLTHFFLHAEDGKYRDAFIEYLAGIYASRRSNDSDVPPLDKLTGLSYAQLDEAYIRYIDKQARFLSTQEIPDYAKGWYEPAEDQPSPRSNGNE